MPKGSNSYGNGRPIVVVQSQIEYSSLIQRKDEGVRLYSSDQTNSLEYSGLKVLSDIQKESRNNLVSNIYKRCLLNEDLFIAAYQKISSNKGSVTAGIDKITLDGYSINEIKKTIEQLKDHSFQFKPARREYIPKANGKLRPLGIPSPRDKIVQQVMVFVLESIFEQKFLDCSNGFRPNKGTHTALKSIAG